MKSGNPVDFGAVAIALRRIERRLCLIATVLALVIGCSPEAPAPTAPPAEVTVSRPLAKNASDSVEYTGTTAPLEQVEVRARVTGFLEALHFEPRQKVGRGDLLFTIDKRPFENALSTAEAGLAMTRAQLDKARHDADRLQRLFERDAAGEEELRDAISKRDSLAASVAADEARLDQARLELSWCEVLAPTRGRVSRNLVDPGNVIAADATVLASIVNDDEVYVYFNVSERDILTIRAESRREREAAGQAASQPELRDLRLPVYVGLMTEEGHPHEGYIDYSSPTVDPSTGTQQVRAVLSNEDGVLLAGLFVRVRIPIGKPYTALTVAERALGSDQGQRYLLVVNEQNVVEYRPVNVGALHQGLRVISAGLKPDERVIVTGIQRVRPGLTVKPIDAPMPAGTAVAASTADVRSGSADARGDGPPVAAGE